VQVHQAGLVEVDLEALRQAVLVQRGKEMLVL
jgi:hypothetical protein